MLRIIDTNIIYDDYRSEGVCFVRMLLLFIDIRNADVYLSSN